MQILKNIILILLFTIVIIIPISINAADDVTDMVELENPLGDDIGSPNQLIGQIINGVLGIVGSLALVMFIYGGFVWMLAAGSNEKVQKGKDILVWATLGLVVIFSAYAVVKFVIEGIAGKT
ncbi:hypothetical protein KAI65_04745 [Candidatus Parcubacteria bacterium]|nr:hypothetical protein [Candidatus Parcubacteria bacterium]